MKWKKEEIHFLIDNHLNKTIDELANSIGRSYESIHCKMTRLGLCARNPVLRTVDKNFFKTWSEEMAYILGYWFADGCISKRNDMKEKFSYIFSISSKDKEQLEKINKVLSSNYKISNSTKKMGKNEFVTYSISIRSKEIYDDIVKLGGTERKSLTAKFPRIPKEYIRHFIRGYFDGDGCFSVGEDFYPNIGFLGTKEFLEELNKYLPLQTNIKTFHSIYRLTYYGDAAKIILEYMYNDSSIYLDRKYVLYNKSIKWIRKRVIKKWTEEEISIIKEKYSLCGSNLVGLNRKKEQIHAMAFRLGIKNRV